jgi:hypothetical protein
LERSRTTNSEDVATYMAVDETATPNGFAPTGTVVDGSAGPGAAVTVEHGGGWTTTLSPEEANIAPESRMMIRPVRKIDRPHTRRLDPTLFTPTRR